MSEPPEEFVALVKDALERLYDPAYLLRHPLAESLLADGGPAGTSRVLALRQLLLDHIDAMDPGAAVPAGASQHRAHRLLELRFVHAMPFREVMEDLGLSQAQYHRDQRHAVQSLALLLWERVRARPAPEAPHAEAGAAGAPDLHGIARGALDTLETLARGRGVELLYRPDGDDAPAPADRTVLRQLIISVVASLLGVARGGRVVLSGGRVGGRVIFRVEHQGGARDAEIDGAEQGLEDARELLGPLGGELSIARRGPDVAVELGFPVHRRSLLVIDDNPDIARLIRRWLSEDGHEVHAARSVAEGLELARRARPDAILLDVMIPERDGWEALQALKHDPDTAHVPVLVCTILRESQLAHALGADGFIRKPLTRAALLEALDRWLPERADRRQPAEHVVDRAQ